jgi:hypothetical protein
MSLMIWGCITFNGVGTLMTVNGNINTAKYIEILEDNLWPVIVRHYPEENYIFEDDNAPVHMARNVQYYKTQNNIRMRTLLKTVGSCWRILCRNSFTVFTMLPTWSAKSWTFGKPFHYITLGTCTGHFQHECWK